MLQLSTYVGAKLFVLDTNVILHDAGCLRNFEENLPGISSRSITHTSIHFRTA